MFEIGVTSFIGSLKCKVFSGRIIGLPVFTHSIRLLWMETSVYVTFRNKFVSFFYLEHLIIITRMSLFEYLMRMDELLNKKDLDFSSTSDNAI